MSSRPHEGFENSRLVAAWPDEAPVSAIHLGAGDALGREVFTQAVALTRAGRGGDWLASTGERAILPAFTADDTARAAARVAVRGDASDAELWALLTDSRDY
jgi:hypothetical protein